MDSGESGVGAFAPGFGTPRQDRRVVDLVLDNLADGYNRRGYKTPSDVFRNFILQRGALGGDTRVALGTVVFFFNFRGFGSADASTSVLSASASARRRKVRSGGAPFSGSRSAIKAAKAAAFGPAMASM